MKRLFIIRHGQTKGNEERRFNGCGTDESLSSSGAEAAKKIRESINSLIHKDALIISSPLKRAEETARLLFGSDRKIRIENDIKEIDFGEFEGKNHKELDGNPGYQAWIDSGGINRIPGGEKLDEYADRVFGFLRSCLKTTDKEELVFVCHGGGIMSIMHGLTGENYYSYIVPNLDGYVCELEVKDDEIILLTYDRLSDRMGG